MGHLLTAGSSGTACSGFEAFQNRTIFDHGTLHDKCVSGEVIVVLGIRDSAFERLGDETGGFARDEREQIDRVGGLATLDGADDFTHLFRRHARVACESLNFHVRRIPSSSEAAAASRERHPALLVSVKGLNFFTGHATVRFENTRRGEFAELVADHVFSDVHSDKSFAVMNVESVADEVGRDGRTARPSLDRFVGARLGGLLDFFEKVQVNEEAFFDGTCHGAKGSGLLLTARFAAVMVNDNKAV